MVGQHQEDDGQRQVVVVQRALFGGRAEARIGRTPALRSATTIFWFGMISIATLAVMIVAIIAPVCSMAPRPEKIWLNTKLAATT